MKLKNGNNNKLKFRRQIIEFVKLESLIISIYILFPTYNFNYISGGVGTGELSEVFGKLFSFVLIGEEGGEKRGKMSGDVRFFK